MFAHYRFHKLSRVMQQKKYQYKHQEEWPAERPLVSVIIPCYNYGAFIKGAIESVLAQTFQRFEILIINDGSTDEMTLTVLDNLCYERTKVIHQTNQGLAQTRNNGAALAVGKYICYLDPDDLLEPTYLEKTLSHLESDESLGSCYSWVHCFGDFDSVWKTENLDPFLLRQGCIAPSHSVLRKAAWRKVKEENGSGFLNEIQWIF